MTDPAPSPRPAPRPAERPFVLLGSACIVGGGLVSAAAAPTASYLSSWAVAYLVLVAGAAQVVLGLGQARLTSDLTRRVLQAELLAWNLGNAAVLVGTLLGAAPALYAGCALLVAALALVLYAVRRARPGWLLTTTRIIVVLLLVSIPVGIVLQAARH